MDRNLKSCLSCAVFKLMICNTSFISIFSNISTRTLIHDNITGPVHLKGQSF